MKEKIITFLKEALKKGKALALDIFHEFKTFNYRSLKSKEGWTTFLKNKKMFISSIAALAIIIMIPFMIGSSSGGMAGGGSDEINLLYENFCNTNSAGGKFGDAIPKLILVPDVEIAPKEGGGYLLSFSGSPRGNTPGLDAYDTITVTYSAAATNGPFSFVSCTGEIGGQRLSIDFSVWNACLQASRYNY